MARQALTKLALAAFAALAAGCASGKKVDPPDPNRVTAGERVDQARRGIGHAAAAPFKDFGLIRPSAPRMLSDIQYPYDFVGLEVGCPQIMYEIGQLDALLGPENYQPPPDKRLGGRAMDEVGRDAQLAADGATTGFIPFRSWVRRASGATKAERDVAHATEMGQMRRAFLRGYGASLGCPNVLPAPPAPAAPAASPAESPSPAASAPEASPPPPRDPRAAGPGAR